MMKRLSSFILLIMIALPFYVQAADIKAPAPIYQIDVTQMFAGEETVIRPTTVAAVAVHPSDTVQRTQSVANIKLEPADLVNKVSQYNAHKSITATGIIGVSGGDSIGIRPIG